MHKTLNSLFNTQWLSDKLRSLVAASTTKTVSKVMRWAAWSVMIVFGISACTTAPGSNQVNSAHLNNLKQYVKSGANSNGYIPPQLITETKDEGRTLLSFFAEQGAVDASAFLINNGADVNLADKLSATPLLAALGAPAYWGTKKPKPEEQTNRLAIVKLLIKQGANTNARDRFGNTPLHYAAAYGYSDIVDWLLNHTAINIDAQNATRNTALHFAGDEGHLSAVELLISHQAQRHMKNQTGATWYHLWDNPKDKYDGQSLYQRNYGKVGVLSAVASNPALNIKPVLKKVDSKNTALKAKANDKALVESKVKAKAKAKTKEQVDKQDAVFAANAPVVFLPVSHSKTLLAEKKRAARQLKKDKRAKERLAIKERKHLAKMARLEAAKLKREKAQEEKLKQKSIILAKKRELKKLKLAKQLEKEKLKKEQLEKEKLAKEQLERIRLKKDELEKSSLAKEVAQKRDLGGKLASSVKGVSATAGAESSTQAKKEAAQENPVKETLNPVTKTMPVKQAKVAVVTSREAVVHPVASPTRQQPPPVKTVESAVEGTDKGAGKSTAKHSIENANDHSRVSVSVESSKAKQITEKKRIKAEKKAARKLEKELKKKSDREARRSEKIEAEKQKKSKQDLARKNLANKNQYNLIEVKDAVSTKSELIQAGESQVKDKPKVKAEPAETAGFKRPKNISLPAFNETIMNEIAGSNPLFAISNQSINQSDILGLYMQKGKLTVCTLLKPDGVVWRKMKMPKDEKWLCDNDQCDDYVWGKTPMRGTWQLEGTVITMDIEGFMINPNTGEQRQKQYVIKEIVSAKRLGPASLVVAGANADFTACK